MPHTPAHNMARTAVILLFAFALIPLAAHAQAVAPTASDDLPRFEVATIKPIDTTHGTMQSTGAKVYPGGRLVLGGYSLKALICTAFNIGYWQLSGGDGWIAKNEYDVEAKPPQTEVDIRYSHFAIADPHLRQMLQALLIDRFQLKFHRETQSGTVYLLQNTHKSSLLVPTTAATAQHPFGGEGFSGDIGHAGDRWVMYNTSMPQLARFISDYQLHHPVLDQTALAGYFDAKWTMTLTDPQGYDGLNSLPLFLQAIGLKLTKSAGPIEIFVIDHAELPSPN